MATNTTNPKDHANRDPITGAPGAHPVGVGVGAGTAGLAGAVAGAALAGPIGAAAGAALGAITGGLAGKAAAESMDPTIEDAYWRSNYKNQSYYVEGCLYEDYQPAYRAGYQAACDHPDKSWDEASANVEANWNKGQEKSALSWKHARHAAKAAWERATGEK